MLTNENLFIQELLHPKTKDRAFRELVSAYKIPLYQHIRNIVIIHADADDVLQNTFIKIFSNLDQFNQESKLTTWMYRIATNESLNFLNTKAKKNALQTQELQENLIDNLYSDEYFDGNEIEIKLLKAIATLPEKQQLVFKMKYYEDLKYEEISNILNTSVGALKASYHLAVKKIENILKTN